MADKVSFGAILVDGNEHTDSPTDAVLVSAPLPLRLTISNTLVSTAA
jgi:hypothetical protein